MSESSVTPCPAFCVEHDNVRDDEDCPPAWAHKGPESKVALGLHGPLGVWLLRQDSPESESTYSVFLYPRDGLMEVPLEDARQLHAELGKRIAQADADRCR